MKKNKITIKEIWTSKWELVFEHFQCQHEYAEVTPPDDWDTEGWRVECPDCELDDFAMIQLIENYDGEDEYEDI